MSLVRSIKVVINQKYCKALIRATKELFIEQSESGVTIPRIQTPLIVGR